MRTINLRWISSLSLSLSLVAACTKDDNGSDSAGNGSSGGQTTGGVSDTNNVTVGGESSGTSAGQSTGIATGGASEGGSSGDGATSAGSSSGGTEPQPNGGSCMTDDQCESNSCFALGALGGVCGECKGDADCADTTMHGCSVPNPLSSPARPALCNDGSFGAGCETSDVCVDNLTCAEILNASIIGLVASTCSDCASDDDCADLTETPLCTINYDVAEVSGNRTCVAAGSVPDGEGCDLAGTGNDACMSGHCVGATLAGITLGVCSVCATDDDCNVDMGETCVLPTIGATGIMPGVCQAAM